MPTIPKRVANRLTAGLKRFQPILSSARARDLNEADTVSIIKGILCEIFGYARYAEITSEHAIRGTFCDLAILVDGQLQFLIEAKAIGVDLNERHTKQAIDYAANQGVNWVILTNAVTWQIYHVTFGKPIDHQLVVEFDMLLLDVQNPSDIESLFLLAKEGLPKSVLDDYHTQRQATNRFLLGALMLSEPVLKAVRRELKHISPDVKLDIADIKDVIKHEVVKRDVIDGEEAKDAQKQVHKVLGKMHKKKKRPTKKSLPVPSPGTALEETKTKYESPNEQ